MDELVGGILCFVSLGLSIISVVTCAGVAETTKKHCYYCEHVDLQENGGYCLDGRHFVLENGVLQEVGECFAK